MDIAFLNGHRPQQVSMHDVGVMISQDLLAAVELALERAGMDHDGAMVGLGGSKLS